MSGMSAQFVSQQDFWANIGCPNRVGDILNRAEIVRLLVSDGLAGRKILDAGCGTGYVAEMLGRRGAHVWGIDECIPFIDAATNSTAHDVARFQVGKIESLPYHDKFFDHVVSISVLQYVPRAYVEEFFRHAARVLKKKGALFVSITHPDLYRLCERDHEANARGKPTWIYFTGRQENDGVDIYTQEYVDADGQISVLNDVRAYSREDLAEMAGRFGFTLVSSRSIEYPPVLVDQYPQWGSTWGYPAYLILEFEFRK
jgi:ubiquinone/menaquinone biosynthesis C-methylase UbiE